MTKTVVLICPDDCSHNLLEDGCSSPVFDAIADVVAVRGFMSIAREADARYYTGLAEKGIMAAENTEYKLCPSSFVSPDSKAGSAQ